MNRTWIKKSISASGNVIDKEENLIRVVDVSSYALQLKLLDWGVVFFVLIYYS